MFPRVALPRRSVAPEPVVIRTSQFVIGLWHLESRREGRRDVTMAVATTFSFPLPTSRTESAVGIVTPG